MIKPAVLPPQKYLKECLRYDRRTGKLYWKKRPRRHFKHAGTCAHWNRRHAGTPAFNTPAEWGYLRGNLDKHAYLAYRVVWKLVRGTEPPDLIDHKDGVPDNNRNQNFRAATNAQNCSNGKRRGVYLEAVSGKWRAHISIGGKKKCLGRFANEADALDVRQKKAREIYGEFARC